VSADNRTEHGMRHPPLRIAIVSTGIWGSATNGLATALAGLGHAVVAYTEDRRAKRSDSFMRLREANVDYWVISDVRRTWFTWLPDRLLKAWLGRRFFTSLVAIIRFLRAHRQVDVVYVDGDWIGFFVALARCLVAFRWIVGINDTLYLPIKVSYPGRLSGGWKQRAKLWVLAKADLIRANSPVTRDALIEAGCDPQRIGVVPMNRPEWIALPARPLDEFRREARNRVRRQWSIAEGEYLVIAMCRLDPVKGLELAIEALGKDRSAGAGAGGLRLMLCGGDRRFQGVGSYRALLEKLAAEHGVTERLIFTGAVPKEDVATYLAAADVHIAPSVIDTFNFAVVEAALVGTPSLMSDMVGAGPWVSERGGGEVLAGRDPSVWAQRLHALASRRRSEAEMAATAQAVADFTSPAQVARTLADWVRV
jgi:glycosyltransferase involved in cell wall biosynthesis